MRDGDVSVVVAVRDVNPLLDVAHVEAPRPRERPVIRGDAELALPPPFREGRQRGLSVRGIAERFEIGRRELRLRGRIEPVEIFAPRHMVRTLADLGVVGIAAAAAPVRELRVAARV